MIATISATILRRAIGPSAALAAISLLLGSAMFSVADAANSPALRLINTIPIPVTPQNGAGGMFSFDISWVDPVNGLYFLADRSNAAIDVIDTSGAFSGQGKSTGPDTFFGQIGGGAFGFAGDTGNTATSGPDGVVSRFPCIFAGDGGSRMISINANVSFVQPASIVNTGGQFRVDEMAYDPADGLVIAANNAETVPFSTIFTVDKTTCKLSNPVKTTFNTAGGVNATNGVEQPAWEPITKRFYASIPEVNGPGDGTGINGGVARITTGGVIETVYQVNYCQPAGLTVGPNGDLMVGCNSVFDRSGKKCSAVVPSPIPTATSAAAHPALCTGTANAQVAICNPGRGCTGPALVAVPGTGGGDEIFFNAGDGNYYVTAGNNPIGPTVGVVSSANNQLTQQIPTLSPIPALTGSAAHGAGTVHSVAASAANNHVYVPLPANTAYPNCTTGCVAVFAAN